MAILAGLVQMLFSLFVTVVIIAAGCFAFDTWNWAFNAVLFSLLWTLMGDWMEDWFEDWSKWP
ncbi:MAG: hypothetical protein VX730_05320 [Pseudomonadota bacterium]|nr:hypothetical protein [Pseudomonadota bacterium]